MSKNKKDQRLLGGSVALAAVLWYLSFCLGGPSFWVKISFSAAILATLAWWSQPKSDKQLICDLPTFMLGIVSAALLYAIFWTGQIISTFLFPFASHQIGSIYGLGDGFKAWQVALILFFITGPAEEIYWRGFLQKRLSRKFGPVNGFLAATALYTGVHLCTLNFMLIGAAAVAGVFWGLMYWRYNNLAANIISHSVWTAVVFAVFPL